MISLYMNNLFMNKIYFTVWRKKLENNAPDTVNQSIVIKVKEVLCHESRIVLYLG